MNESVDIDKSLADETYNILLDEILSAQLMGGTIVQERRLAARLGVSRSPMRDALGRLEGQGLLVRNVKNVLTVRVITLQDYLNSISLRLMIEPNAAAEAVVRLSPERVAELSAMLKLIEDDPHPEPSLLWQFDDALHMEIAEASGNPFMADTILRMRRYTTIFERQRKLTHRKPGLSDHRAILTALAQQDAQAAQAAMVRHLDQVRQGVLSTY